MKGSYLWVLVLVVPALPLPAQGGILFGKKPAPKDPMLQVPQLLFQLKMDQNEGKRAAAAEELRDYDCSKIAEVVPILIDVLQSDKSPTVRAETAHTLSRIRPVSPMAAQALENASKKDATMRVRVQAWTGLRMIRLAGAYPQAPKDPKSGRDGTTIVTNPSKDPGRGPNDGVVILPYNPQAQPTPAQPVVNSKTNAGPNIPRPLPSSPSVGFSTAVPTQSQRVFSPPPSPEDGPALGPPPVPRN
jgi:HEAT repeat protein